VTPDLVKFEEFELDLRAYHLLRSGRTRKLERIPMELLFLLVERRGHLVTREEIIEKLWGKNVFLDTDNAINTAIRKIRQVLRDNPEQPRFIQTVTGRGYRFRNLCQNLCVRRDWYFQNCFLKVPIRLTHKFRPCGKDDTILALSTRRTSGKHCATPS